MRTLTVILTMLAGFLSLLAIVTIAKRFGFSPHNFHDPTKVFDDVTLITALSVLSAPIVIVVLVQKTILKLPLRDLGFRKSLLKPFLIGSIIGVFLKGIATAATYLLSPSAKLIPALSGVSCFEYLPYGAWFLFALFLNSLAEELAYRSFPIKNLSPTSLPGRVLVVAATAVAFSIMHFSVESPNLLLFLYRLGFGLLAGFIFLKSNSLWLIVGLHSGWNFVALAVTNSAWQTGTLYRLTGLKDGSESIANIIVLLIGSFICLLLPHAEVRSQLR